MSRSSAARSTTDRSAVARARPRRDQPVERERRLERPRHSARPFSRTCPRSACSSSTATVGTPSPAAAKSRRRARRLISRTETPRPVFGAIADERSLLPRGARRSVPRLRTAVSGRALPGPDGPGSGRRGRSPPGWRCRTMSQPAEIAADAGTPERTSPGVRGVVSHDLRNPLDVAQGRLQLARAECDSEHLDNVAAAIERSNRLIDDLLTLARAGTRSPRRRRWTSEQSSTDAGRTFRRTARHCGSVGTDGRGGPGAARTATENLVRHAVEHGFPQSEVSLDAAEGDASDLTVTVGALERRVLRRGRRRRHPAEERDDVFEAGYTTAADGTGFGLRIVRQSPRPTDGQLPSLTASRRRAVRSSRHRDA